MRMPVTLIQVMVPNGNIITMDIRDPANRIEINGLAAGPVVLSRAEAVAIQTMLNLSFSEDS